MSETITTTKPKITNYKHNRIEVYRSTQFPGTFRYVVLDQALRQRAFDYKFKSVDAAIDGAKAWLDIHA